jgi:hypothetical protein
MECKFTIGQKVVCVNDDVKAFMISGRSYRGTTLDGLTKGHIYTIKEIYENPMGNICVSLEEIIRCCPITGEEEIVYRGFVHSRFAPLKEKKTDISVFEQIVNKINAGDHDNNYGFYLDEVPNPMVCEKIIEPFAQQLYQADATVFLDHPLNNNPVAGIWTGFGSGVLLTIQKTSILQKHREQLLKTDYYTNWDDDDLRDLA